MKNDDFYLKKYPDDIYSLSAPLWSAKPAEGSAIMQSWLVKGTKCTLVIDSPMPELSGFREYIETQMGLPAILMCTHGHVDHIGCNSQFAEVYMAKEDWSLAAGDGIVRSTEPDAYRNLSYRLIDVEETECIDLGGRSVIVYHVPGHTAGSIVLYEKETGILFSGDTIAWRILYGMSDWTPLEVYMDALRRISRLDIRKMQ